MLKTYILLILSLVVCGPHAFSMVYDPSSVWKKDQVNYYFFKDSRQEYRLEKVKLAISYINKSIGRNVLVETKDHNKSDVRIRFVAPENDTTKGTSYVGSYANTIPKTKETMLFMVNEGEAPSINTIIHEFLHALGILHEHQNPNSILYSKYTYAQRNSEEFFKEVCEETGLNKEGFDDFFRVESPIRFNYGLYDPLSVMDYSFTHEDLSQELFQGVMGLQKKIIDSELIYMSPMEMAGLRYLYNKEFQKKHSKKHRIVLDLSQYKDSKSKAFEFKMLRKGSDLELIVQFKHPLFINTKMKINPMLMQAAQLSVNYKPIQLTEESSPNPIFDNFILGENRIQFRLGKKKLPLRAYQFEMEFIELDYEFATRFSKENSEVYINPTSVWLDALGSVLGEQISSYEEKNSQMQAQVKEISSSAEDSDLLMHARYKHLLEQLKKNVSEDTGEKTDLRVLISRNWLTEDYFKSMDDIFKDFFWKIKSQETNEKISAILEFAPETISGYVLVKTVVMLSEGEEKEALSYFLANQPLIREFHAEERKFFSLLDARSKEYDKIINIITARSSDLGVQAEDYLFIGAEIVEEISKIYETCRKEASCTKSKISEISRFVEQTFQRYPKPTNREQLKNFFKGLMAHDTAWVFAHLVAASTYKITSKQFTKQAFIEVFEDVTKSIKLLELGAEIMSLREIETYRPSLPTILSRLSFHKNGSIYWALNDFNYLSRLRYDVGESVSTNSFISWAQWEAKKVPFVQGSAKDPVVDLRKLYKDFSQILSDVIAKPCNPSRLKGYEFNYDIMKQAWFSSIYAVIRTTEVRFHQKPVSNFYCKPKFSSTAEFYNYHRVLEAVYEYK